MFHFKVPCKRCNIMQMGYDGCRWCEGKGYRVVSLVPRAMLALARYLRALLDKYDE